MKPRPERVREVKIIIFEVRQSPFFNDFQCFGAFLKHKENDKTGRILGEPKAISGLGQTSPNAIHRLPCPGQGERKPPDDNIKEALEMDHHHWI